MLSSCSFIWQYWSFTIQVFRVWWIAYFSYAKSIHYLLYHCAICEIFRFCLYCKIFIGYMTRTALSLDFRGLMITRRRYMYKPCRRMTNFTVAFLDLVGIFSCHPNWLAYLTVSFSLRWYNLHLSFVSGIFTLSFWTPAVTTSNVACDCNYSSKSSFSLFPV